MTIFLEQGQATDVTTFHRIVEGKMVRVAAGKERTS
jgi:hypothetical protein